jgi:hypothetical protein
VGTLQLTVQDAPGFLPGSRVYRLECSHGVSSAALVPGKKPITDATVVDLVLPGHHRRYGCSCSPGVPSFVQPPAPVPGATTQSMR